MNFGDFAQSVSTTMFILTIIKIFFITLYFTAAFSSREPAISFRIRVQSYEVSAFKPNLFSFFKISVCAHQFVTVSFSAPTVSACNASFSVKVYHRDACSAELYVLVAEATDVGYGAQVLAYQLAKDAVARTVKDAYA